MPKCPSNSVLLVPTNTPKVNKAKADREGHVYQLSILAI